MTSSAITGNTSGLASATSPGLVGITTQTFAGDKTFDGGAIIKANTGAAIAASYVGEVKAVTGAFYNLSSAAWLASAASLTLNAGNWLVCGSFSFLRNNATVNNFEFAVAIVGVTTPATIGSDYGSKYSLRTGFDIQTTGINNSFSVFNGSLPTFFVKSNGTNLTFADGTTLYSGGQVITFAAYCSAYTVAIPQAAGQITAIRLP